MCLKRVVSLFEQTGEICDCLLVRSEVGLFEFVQSFIHTLERAEEGREALSARTGELLV